LNFSLPPPARASVGVGRPDPIKKNGTGFFGGGGGGERRPIPKAENLTTILCRCHEIWELNFLELPGPLQACNGTALPLLYTCILYITLDI
jgi:hypothetical protein